MKTVKKSDLRALALKKGATIKDSAGHTFNANKIKASVKPEPRPEEEPEEEHEDTETENMGEGLSEIASRLEHMGKSHVMILAELKDEISRIKLETPGQIMEWRFKIKRDKKGDMEEIQAIAGRIV